MAFERERNCRLEFSLSPNKKFENGIRWQFLKIEFVRVCAVRAPILIYFPKIIFNRCIVNLIPFRRQWLRLLPRMSEETMHPTDRIIHIQNRRYVVLPKQMPMRTAAILIAAVRNVKLDATMHSTISSSYLTHSITFSPSPSFSYSLLSLSLCLGHAHAKCIA